MKTFVLLCNGELNFGGQGGGSGEPLNALRAEKGSIAACSQLRRESVGSQASLTLVYAKLLI